MGVYCYADDSSLLSPTYTGLQEMLKNCERYANDHDIMFNAKKSQLLYYGSHTNNFPCTAALSLQNGQKIQFVKSCTHLVIQLCEYLYNILVDNAVNDLNCKLNNLLADFSHCNNSTLFVLFQSYCMNVYGCQIWYYIIKYVNKFYTA